MKKIHTLFTILALTLGTAPTATAQYAVMASTDKVEGGDQAVRYEYNIENWGGNCSPNGILYTAGGNTSGNIIIKRKVSVSSTKGSKAINFFFKKTDNEKFPYNVYTSNVIKEKENYIIAPVYYYTEPNAQDANNNSYNNIYVNGTDEKVMKLYISERLFCKNGKHPSVNIFCEGTSDNNYLRWNADNTKGITVQTNGFEGDVSGWETASTDAGNWKTFSFVPAAPAPMIFSKSAKYEGKYYATYSTGVAATIPEGVTAYTAKYNATSEALELTPVEETTIPVNTGVLLALDENTTNTGITINKNGKTVVYPATSETAGDLTDTGFEPSCTSDNNTGPLTVAANTETETAYILGVGESHGLGFYKLSETNRTMDCYKAYLKVTSTSAEAIKLEFPNSTGISTAATGNKADAPVYDLSGRKVTKTSKGNIYIQNGKKLLAK